jgi:hypothetical protein
MTHTFDIPDQPEPPSNVFAMATPHHLLIKLHWEIKQLRLSVHATDRLRRRHTSAPSGNGVLGFGSHEVWRSVQVHAVAFFLVHERRQHFELLR